MMIKLTSLATVLLGVFANPASAATLARWDFENGNLLASEQGNFIATSIDVVDGGPFAYAPGAGIGGGGALAYEQDSNQSGVGYDNIIFFTIENTHPTDSIELDVTSLSFGGEIGESYGIFYRINMGSINDLDDGVQSAGAWTTFFVGPTFQAIPAGGTFSIGWGLFDTGNSNLSTHYFDNIQFTGIEPVPEPSVTLLFLIAALGAGQRRRR